MLFDAAEEIADTVLYEGYMLYPYRASALKNRFRWQFGVLAPRAYSEAKGSERWSTRTECLAELGDRAALTVKVRFLQLQARTIEIPCGSPGDWRAVEAATVDNLELTSWEEAVERSFIVTDLDARGSDPERVFPFEVPGGRDVDVQTDASGRAAARIVRERWPITGQMAVKMTPCSGMWKVTVRVENATRWTGDAERSLVLRQSMLGVHMLLAVDRGAFVSVQDPPPEAAALARSCVNEGSWPVLAGPEGSRQVILCSPIILYDYPAIAPESAGHLFDATEIDELLTLRVMTLTEREKHEARTTDERTRRLVDRTDRTPPRVLERLHGTVRGVTPPPASLVTEQTAWEALLNPPTEAVPEQASVDTAYGPVTKGCRVQLQPRRRADPMDMFLEGRIATVAGVYRTLEDDAYVAVTIDDDPGADLRRAVGRFFYFSAEEIVLVRPGGGSAAASEG